MPSPLSEHPLQSSPPLTGERVTFTGTLASMTHSQASELVSHQGGEATSHVSRQTTLLVIGEEGWPLEEDGQPSQKILQAVQFIELGAGLRILQESAFLRLLGLEESGATKQKLHTPAMLQQSLGIRSGIIRRWARLGIIRPVRRVFRLPYFDIQEVAGVRRLQELLEAGVPDSRIEQSLADLQRLLPSFEHPLARLELLARDSSLVFRDGTGLLDPSTGQRIFDFEIPETAIREPDQPETGRSSQSGDAEQIQQSWNADDWFHQGCRLLEEDRPEEAVEAFRLSLMDAPGDPETQFHLADALVRSGNPAAALERYHMAVELDHDYIEAWTQLGCLRNMLGDSAGALDAFNIALESHPDYSDALYFKATALSDAGRQEEADAVWKAYLHRNSRGPWADIAREQLQVSGRQEH